MPSKSLSYLLIMSSRRLYGGRVTLFVLLSCCRLSFAVAPAASPAPATSAVLPTPAPAGQAPGSIYASPGNPASLSNSPFGDSSANDTTPSLRALPVDSSAGGPDASNIRKFYTLTASLRTTYDSNVNTTRNDGTGAQSSIETEISPSILATVPTSEGTLTGRYSFGLTLYENAPGSSGNNQNSGITNGSIQTSHDLLAQFTHPFSDRFQLNLGEEFRYQIQPNIIQSIGTNYQNGPFYSNFLTGTFSSQWSPKLSSVLTFGDTVVRYAQTDVGNDQNSVQNNGSFNLSYAILPKFSTGGGFQIDNITYESGNRGYTSYTLFGSASWQALPSLSFTGRAGGSYTQNVGDSTALLSPYAALSANWTLGARSSLNFDYEHSITPTDQAGANGQQSDRASANFSYQVTPRLGTFLEGIFTISNISNSLQVSGAGNSVDESQNVYAVDFGATYTYNSYLSFDCGLTFSGVRSNISNNDYSRDEAYVGVRGTY